MRQLWSGAYQNTFGSRKSRLFSASTGLPSYLRQRLLLDAGGLVLAGVDRDQRGVIDAPESRGVPGVEHHAARVHRLHRVVRDRDRPLVPVDEVGADGVAPRDVTELRGGRIRLVEEVIPAVQVDQAVRI